MSKSLLKLKERWRRLGTELPWKREREVRGNGCSEEAKRRIIMEEETLRLQFKDGG